MALWKAIRIIGSVLIALAPIYFAYQQLIASRMSEADRYLERAAKFRPDLVLISANVVSVEAVPIGMTKQVVPTRVVDGVQHCNTIVRAGVSYRAILEVLLENRGNSEAICSSYVAQCFPSYAMSLREALLGDSAFSLEAGSDTTTFYYAPRERLIRPHMTLKGQITLTLCNGFTANQFVVHLFFPYHNGLGNLYDLYAWLDVDARFANEGVDSVASKHTTTGSIDPESTAVRVGCYFNSHEKGFRQNVYTLAESKTFERRLRTVHAQSRNQIP